MTKNTQYGRKFFSKRHEASIRSAELVLSTVLDVLPRLNSAVDLGCGVGTWLAVLESKGVDRVEGRDGDWVDRDLLEIPGDSFIATDLNDEVQFATRFDLAMTLEVAEHLPPTSADTFVRTCCNASDHVLFSAAIPRQGGRGHVNEQWQSYWAELFARHGYSPLDIVRPAIWDRQEVHPWYRQNTLLYVRDTVRSKLNLSQERLSAPFAIDLVHPEMYLRKFEYKGELTAGWKHFLSAAKDKLRGRRRPHLDAEYGVRHRSDIRKQPAAAPSTNEKKQATHAGNGSAAALLAVDNPPSKTSASDSSIVQFPSGVKVYRRHNLWNSFENSNFQEQQTETLFRQLLSEVSDNGVFVNCGSAIGYYPLLASRLMPELVVHAFEPLAEHREFFAENVELNELLEAVIAIHPEGIARQDGCLEFYENNYGSTILNRNTLTWKQRLKRWRIRLRRRLDAWGLTDHGIRCSQIPVLSLPSMIARCGGGPIDLLQMDIQGAEVDALESGIAELRGGLIRRALISTHGPALLRRCVRLLKETGFEIKLTDSPDKGDGTIVAIHQSVRPKNSPEDNTSTPRGLRVNNPLPGFRRPRRPAVRRLHAAHETALPQRQPGAVSQTSDGNQDKAI